MPDPLTRRAAVLIALAVFVVDRVSKYLVEAHVSAFDVKPVIPGFFDIVKSHNAGVAFGILSESNSALRTALLIAFSVVALAAMGTMLWRIARLDRPTAVGLSLIFGGALGNLLDRVLYGSVIDFLDFHGANYHWYTFNIADSAISSGAVLILISMLRTSPARSGKVAS
jgi:signal peptidase II